MKAYLIDPETQSFREVDFDGTEAHMHALLGADRILELIPQSFDAGSLGERGDALYIGDYRVNPYPSGPDDDLEEADPTFLLDVYSITGRALVLGVAEDGSDTSASIQIDELARRIDWGRERLFFRERNIEKRRHWRAEAVRRQEEALANPQPPSSRPWQKSPF